MNWEMMKRNVGGIFRLIPTERRLARSGRRLPDREYEWLLRDAGNDMLELENISTGHLLKVGKDYVYSYGTDAPRGRRYGYLTLKCQVFLQGNELKIIPNARPGDPVDPPEVFEPVEKIVDFKYPEYSGLSDECKMAGYTVVWCRESEVVGRIDNGNYELVVIEDKEGVPTSFRLCTRPEDQILLMRRYNPDTDPA